MNGYEQDNSDKNKFVQRVPVVESSRLFGKSNEIMIRHEGAVYRLRITRNGKLIMNK
ncbi:MAG: hypothetical protein B6I25_01560 [Planctomycetales bacterium 4572_13]|nr:MAG: hypothetical protein B6I25_01560 [Planctomycetales bacterium 4572_13]